MFVFFSRKFSIETKFTISCIEPWYCLSYLRFGIHFENSGLVKVKSKTI